VVEAQRRGKQDENINPALADPGEPRKRRGPAPGPSQPIRAASWASFLQNIKSFRKQPFDVETFIPISDLEFPDGNHEGDKSDGRELAKHIAAKVWDTTEYCFM